MSLVSNFSKINVSALAPGSYAAARSQQVRTLVGFVRNALGLEPPANPDDPQPSNRFFPWVESPSQDLRDRAARIMKYGRCRVTGKDIQYTCPLSGIPTHHSREAWEQDENYHKNKIYEILKKVNIYEHDLRSGRAFPEFDFPQDQDVDRAVNLQNWDLFFYTRNFYSMDTEFQLATVTKMLSYPITIASVLHEWSPYSLHPRGPITLEGLKSLSALRYTLYPKEFKSGITKDRPMRIFILGARAESQLPGHVWKQFQYLFPLQAFEIHFIGPESILDPSQLEHQRQDGEKVGTSASSLPLTKSIDNTLTLVYHTEYFHDLHKAQDFFPYDPYNDVFFAFHPGFASPENSQHWMGETMEALLDTKCAIFHTGFNESDILSDIDAIQKTYGKEIDVLMEPVKNVFGSTKWELNDLDPQQVYQFNMYIAGFRGKRYHAIKYE